MTYPRVLLLGSGFVSKPLARYLLAHGIGLTVVSPFVDKAQELIGDHPFGEAHYWTSDDREGLDVLVHNHDVIISLLPAPLHPMVARRCIDHRKDLVTTSYVSPEMRGLNSKAKQAGVLFLNELGVDPGLDHMSAMTIIDDIKDRGGEITSFRSYCGGLPSPDSNDNPWGYKFSWSPLGVLRAGTNAACYRKAGELVYLAPEHIFHDVHHLDNDGMGKLEAYPNRDAVKYSSLYRLPNVQSMFRGTLRYKGWSQTMRRVGELGLLNLSPRADLPGLTWPQLMSELVHCPESRLRELVAENLWLEQDHPTMEKLEWLGVFSDLPVDERSTSVAEALSYLMQQKMVYGETDRDMIVMHHVLEADFGDHQERITSTMVDHGERGGDSSMARTVSLPAAIAVRMVLEGKVKLTGVHIPTTRELYAPILEELATLGIALEEQVTRM